MLHPATHLIKPAILSDILCGESVEHFSNILDVGYKIVILQQSLAIPI